jgi:pectin methylesterase-like acyl-CoA thioesterase
MKKILLLLFFAFLLCINYVRGQSKIDVWDFGAAQLDAGIYNNHLDSATINSQYPISTIPGTSGITIPATGFTAGDLSYVTNGTNDRLRTTNTKLTRYDANIANVTGYTGRVYVNAGSSNARYLSLTLGEDDEVTLISRSDVAGRLNFVYAADPAAQTDVVDNATGSAGEYSTHHFVAKQAGTYRIFDVLSKPSYYRVYRKAATYATINGSADVSQANGIPDGYGVIFTNNAGKTWNSVVSNNTFSIDVPAGYNYTLSLSDANGYIISNGSSLDVTASTTTCEVTILKADLFTVSGAITGLNPTDLAKLTLVYTPDPAANKIFVPVPVINVIAGTYTVQLEPNCQYTISATGINDFGITNNTITIGTSNTTSDVAFTAKPVYNVTINLTGLTAEQLAKLGLTFTNLNEPGYSYGFSSLTGITLRDGTYSISYSGLDEYPVQLGLTSNITISGADVSKDLAFVPVTVWSFDDKAIPNGTPAYKGMLFTGTLSSELAKGHITAKANATIQVPVNVGDKIKVTYYYAADFTIEGAGPYVTTSGTTNTLEYAEYAYTGTDAGYVTITIGSGVNTTYITEISKYAVVAYQPTIHVGTDKEYKTINEALNAIVRMDRTSTDRVTVMIDPGNYEEMLVVNSPNVTLKNAATSPNIDIINKGVDIDANAVRITSYYGTGYNYYSMKNNQKWDADVLRVNKENGSLTYVNTGAGTTNGSYWNATVVISANGFEAENIIFENSFNQYISKKESEDVVVMWEVGNKGLRPTTMGSTDVQNRSFVERAAAIAITNNTDKVVLTKCRVIGRQDAFYGGTGTRVVVYKSSLMGAVDYIFGGMTAVFYKTDLVMNTSDVGSDAAYLTAAQQSSGRGYLMYKCTVKSTIPGIESASTFLAKPGYFGRPWQPTTSEVVFYNTTVDTSYFTGSEGKSLISPEGWTNSLGAESNKMYEYGTIERSGENNLANRVAWSTLLSLPTLTDGTEITPFNFTKGNDDWDPIQLEVDALAVSSNTLTITQPANSTKTFDITSNVSWIVKSDKNWLTVSKSSGFDNSTITLKASENAGTSSRSATVKVSGSGVADQIITVTQNATATGINDINENTLKIFPNPAKDLVNIQRESSKSEKLIITDINGKKIFEKKLTATKESVDISSLSSGVYILNVGDAQTKLLVK